MAKEKYMESIAPINPNLRNFAIDSGTFKGGTLMKHFARILWLAGLLTLCLCLSLTACDGGDTDETTPTPSETDTPTATATEEPTEPDTSAEELTDAATEEPTEPVTEEPTLMLKVDLDGVTAVDARDFVTRATRCSVSFENDESEGKVLRMTTKGIVAAGTVQPSVLLELGELVSSMNGILPNTTEYPHVVLKVKAYDLWSRSFCFFGGETPREAADSDGFARTTRVADSDDWQYIYLNLTPFTKDWSVFYLNFEKSAGKDGESMDLAEVHFFATAEEALALCPAVSDTYPITEQTMDDYTLKVMSFNVQTEKGTKVDFDLRAELLRDLLDELQPDSIGMQEVTPGWLQRMDTFAFNQSYAGVGAPRVVGNEANSIYYRKDKFDLVDHGTFWLSKTPNVAGSALPGVNYVRICTWAHLKDKTTGYEYIHINTHLDNNGNNSADEGRNIRKSQARVILEFIQTLPDLPMVLTGDFNQKPTTSEGEIYALFKNILGLSSFKSSTGEEITGCFADARTDAKDTVSEDAWASLTSYWQEGSDKYNPAYKPIDYVFYTPDDYTAMVYRNIHYHRDGIYLSDHLPQYCELTVKAPAEGEGN